MAKLTNFDDQTMEKKRPWEQLQVLIEENSISEVRSYIESLKSEDLVSAVSHINVEDQARLLSMLSPEDAADLVEGIPLVQAIKPMTDLDVSSAAAIISEMPSDEQADLLGEMSDTDAEAIINQMEAEGAKNVRELIKYESDMAGGLMITEFLAYEQSDTVSNVVSDLGRNIAKYDRYKLRHIYVIHKGQFVGVLMMRDLLLSQPNSLLSDIAKEALTVNVHTPLEELIDFFDTHDFYAAPVTDEHNHLKGVLLRKDLRELQAEMSNLEHLETQGIVGGEEIRTMPVLLRSRRRLSWLSVNILLNIVAASVIAFYQDVLASVIALAVFLPIISDMSGCSGNQAVAVSLRELSLGVVRPFEIARVWIQEVSVGLLNGLVLGLLIGAAAWMWNGSLVLGLVVGGALAINTVVAVSLGGTIPLFLKHMKVDPALASGPILTTVTDMFGFFLALSFAGMALGHLQS